MTTENGTMTAEAVEAAKAIEERAAREAAVTKMTNDEIFAGTGAKGQFGTWMDPDKIWLQDDEDDPLFDKRGLKEPKEEFIKNIEQNGIIQNVTVRKNPDTGKIECVAGRRRVLAARILKKRGAKNMQVPVALRRGETWAQLGVKIAENAAREADDDDPVARARDMRQFVNLGGTPEQLAVNLGVSVGTVNNLLGLLDAPQAIVKAVQKKEITAAEGYKLAKVAKKDPEKAKETLSEMLAAVEEEEGDAGKPKKSKKAKRAAKKAALAKTTKSGYVVRGKKELVGKLKEMEEDEIYKAAQQEIVAATLKWVLGADRALSGACTKV